MVSGPDATGPDAYGQSCLCAIAGADSRNASFLFIRADRRELLRNGLTPDGEVAWHEVTMRVASFDDPGDGGTLGVRRSAGSDAPGEGRGHLPPLFWGASSVPLVIPLG